jgi:hypothetical protein
LKTHRIGIIGADPRAPISLPTQPLRGQKYSVV